MTGFPWEFAEHSLNISPTHKPFAQKRKSFVGEGSLGACNEVDKLVKANIL